MGGTVQTLPKPIKLGKIENGRNSSDTPGRNRSDTSKTNETGDFNFWYLKRKYNRAKQHLEAEKFVQLISEGQKQTTRRNLK